ncbi:MAG: alkaline phosphatase family protein, partial [Bacteroidales bacterium]|nr:alkaline phosphatase family protein [Bacteroidales bacterium]
MLLKSRLFLTLFALLGPIFMVPSNVQAQTDKPTLIVGIVVDGLKYDWIERYQNLLGEGGIKKLLKQGTSYTDTSVPFMLADIGSSNASISTGTPPAIHGIVSENWYDRLRREQTNCTRDFLAKSTGGKNDNGRQSASHLLSNTIGDQLILASNYKGKVVSVSFRAEAAILLEGHIPGSAYWFDTPSGNWITSSQYANALPDWVNNVNARNAANQYLGREWNLLLAENLYTGCPPDDNDLETGYVNQFKTFPYKVNRISRESLTQDNEILGKMPFGNTLTTDFAITALLEE